MFVNGDVRIEKKVFEFANELYLDFDIYKELIDYIIDSNRTLSYQFSRKTYLKIK